MRWWQRVTPGRWVLLAVLVVALLGTTGSLIWDYPSAPFNLLGSAAVVVNFVWMVRDGMRAPVPGRPDLSPPPRAKRQAARREKHTLGHDEGDGKLPRSLR
jgi:hypothetical protein